MAHIVTCVYCKQRFDRDKYPFVQVSARRYAHPECQKQHEENLSEEEKSLQKLHEYIKSLLQIDYITPRVQKQIKTYHEDYHYTYSGIHKSLVYFYEIKQNPKDKAQGGIGIVPFVYQDAYNYYRTLWEARQKNTNKNVSNYVPEVKQVVIHIPERKTKKRKLFTFLDEEVADDNSEQ